MFLYKTTVYGYKWYKTSIVNFISTYHNIIKSVFIINVYFSENHLLSLSLNQTNLKLSPAAIISRCRQIKCSQRGSTIDKSYQIKGSKIYSCDDVIYRSIENMIWAGFFFKGPTVRTVGLIFIFLYWIIWTIYSGITKQITKKYYMAMLCLNSYNWFITIRIGIGITCL